MTTRAYYLQATKFTCIKQFAKSAQMVHILVHACWQSACNHLPLNALTAWQVNSWHVPFHCVANSLLQALYLPGNIVETLHCLCYSCLNANTSLKTDTLARKYAPKRTVLTYMQDTEPNQKLVPQGMGVDFIQLTLLTNTNNGIYAAQGLGQDNM